MSTAFTSFLLGLHRLGKRLCTKGTGLAVP